MGFEVRPEYMRTKYSVLYRGSRITKYLSSRLLIKARGLKQDQYYTWPSFELANVLMAMATHSSALELKKARFIIWRVMRTIDEPVYVNGRLNLERVIDYFGFHVTVQDVNSRTIIAAERVMELVEQKRFKMDKEVCDKPIPDDEPIYMCLDDSPADDEQPIQDDKLDYMMTEPPEVHASFKYTNSVLVMQFQCDEELLAMSFASDVALIQELGMRSAKCHSPIVVESASPSHAHQCFSGSDSDRMLKYSLRVRSKSEGLSMPIEMMMSSRLIAPQESSSLATDDCDAQLYHAKNADWLT